MTDPLLWTLVAIHVAMGAFDTLYHHEWTERLPWRPSQGHELTLHAIRNGFYALLFLTLGFAEVHGWWAVAVMAVLIAEVAITLMDFVEEDLSRKLPASERINHTLLALNYGAILVLLLPVLLRWAGEPTALIPAFHGPWSVGAALSAAGVALFGLRDHLASRRAGRLVPRPAAELAAALGERRTVLVTGATGFVGRRLAAALSEAGHDVIALVRDPAAAGAALAPPVRLVTDLRQVAPETPIDAVVNLAGEPIADRPWTAPTAADPALPAADDAGGRAPLRASPPAAGRARQRVGGRLLRAPRGRGGPRGRRGPALLRAPPLRGLGAGRRGGDAARRPGVVRLRIGLVLGVEGGILARLLTPTEFGLGGPLGSGRQWMSWIARDDLVRLACHAIAHPSLAGAVNATAPEPVRNADFARALGRALGRPAVLRVPAVLLRPLGAFADELLLGGQRAAPDKALASGFAFRTPTLPGALESILGARPGREGEAARAPLPGAPAAA